MGSGLGATASGPELAPRKALRFANCNAPGAAASGVVCVLQGELGRDTSWLARWRLVSEGRPGAGQSAGRGRRRPPHVTRALGLADNLDYDVHGHGLSVDRCVPRPRAGKPV